MKALIFESFGGPEVLRYTDIPDPKLEPGCVLVSMEAIGLNFADIYRRRGGYHLVGKPPYVLGYEGAGVVIATASDVQTIKVSDRVAFADVPHANAELVCIPADKAIPVPDDISLELASGLLLQGMTAHYLVNDSYRVKSGDNVLIHAAAGGVGQLLIQLSKLKGARVLGLTSSHEKRAVALKALADEVVLYDSDWVSHALVWSGSKAGVDIVYDSVGKTLLDSFKATRTKGTVVFFGMAGGDPDLIDPRMLMDSSKTLVGGDLWDHLNTYQERLNRSNSLFDYIRQGMLKVAEFSRFALRDGEDAHRLLESRNSTGKILLIP
jgi:NADPH:quinone reductase